MNFGMSDGILITVIIGIVAFLAKADRKNIYISIGKLAEEVGNLVNEMKEERRERAQERLSDLNRLSKLEAAFSRLLGEHEAAVAAGGHYHRRKDDHGTDG